MTWEQFKQRIIDSTYLPNWLRDGIVTIKPTDGRPEGPVLQASTIKWCPFARNTSRSGIFGLVHGWNRIVDMAKGPDGRLAGAVISTKSSPCVRDACQMWTGQDCGLKTLTPGIQALIQSEGEKMRAAITPPAEETATEEAGGV